MTDNTDNKQVENLGESTPDASPADKKGTDKVETAPEGEVAESEVPEQSERAKSRQHELAKKLKTSEKEKQELKTKLAQFEPEGPVSKPSLPFLPKETPQPGARELTQQEYDQEVSEKANQMVDLRVGQLEQKIVRREQRLSDIELLEVKYPELKPGEGQNIALTKKVIGLFKTASKSNPDLSLKEFVGGIMELREAGQSEDRESATAQMAKNESVAVLTPEVSKTKKVASEEDLIKKMKSGELSAKDARKYLESAD